MIALLIQKINETGMNVLFTPDAVTNSIGEFVYRSKGHSFEAYFRKCKGIFKKNCQAWPEEKKRYNCI